MSPTANSSVRPAPDAPGGARPHFSIVVPTWNRRDAVRRCLKSILGQDFGDFELIVVDGNSEDGTVEAVRGHSDARIRVVLEPRRSGCWGARLLGVDQARGRWIIFIDSDDELAAGSLARFAGRTRSAPEDVGIIGASYRMDDGLTEPWPPMPSGPVGLVENLGWLDVAVRPDYLHAIRREVFETTELPLPQGSGALFELDVFDRWRKDVSPDIEGLVHTDMPNRMVGAGKGFSRESIAGRAMQAATIYERLIEKYGPRLAVHARRFLLETRRRAGLMYLIAGRRGRGARFLIRYLLGRPCDVRAWGVLLCGTIGPRALIWARRNLT